MLSLRTRIVLRGTRCSLVESPFHSRCMGRLGTAYRRSQVSSKTDSSPRVARTWGEQTGDAGWAGYVASILESRAAGKPFYVIHRPDQNKLLLEMIDEAIAFCPKHHRWNVTFSTYCGELPPGVDCRLRCVLSDTPEAVFASRNVKGDRFGIWESRLAPKSRYVDAARSGIIVPSENADTIGSDREPIYLLHTSDDKEPSSPEHVDSYTTRSCRVKKNSARLCAATSLTFPSSAEAENATWFSRRCFVLAVPSCWRGTLFDAGNSVTCSLS